MCFQIWSSDGLSEDERKQKLQADYNRSLITTQAAVDKDKADKAAASTAAQTPPPITPTASLLSSDAITAAQAAERQRKRASAGSTLLSPINGPDKSPGPRLNKLTLLGT